MARLLKTFLRNTALAAAALSFVSSATAAPLCFRGVNLSGAEYGDRNGKLGINYTYPQRETIGYFARKGMNVIRLPFKWERLQPVLNQPLNPDELQNIKTAVAAIRKSGMAVILDPHNFAYYDKTQVGQPPVTDLAFGDFWARLALEFKNQNGIIFGLMNEPHDVQAPAWLQSANTAIQSIRAVGAKNLILVPGTLWTGAWTWDEDRLGGGSNAKVMTGIKDPIDFYAYEFHQYMDADSSGTHSTCEGAKTAAQALEKVSAWLRQNKKRGLLGEFGAADNAACIAGLKSMVSTMNRNSDVWLGWTYWAAGEWWPKDEPFNIQPRKTPERPQMKTLEAFLKPGPASRNSCPTVKDE